MELGGSQHINLYALIKRRSYESPVRLPLMADILSHLDGDKSGGGKRNLIIIRRPCRCVECAECRSRLWSRGGQRGGAVLLASRCFALLRGPRPPVLLVRPPVFLVRDGVSGTARGSPWQCPLWVAAPKPSVCNYARVDSTRLMVVAHGRDPATAFPRIVTGGIPCARDCP